MSSIELQAYELRRSLQCFSFRQLSMFPKLQGGCRLSEEEARLFIQYFEDKAEEKINQKKDIFLTKDDKVDLIK